MRKKYLYWLKNAFFVLFTLFILFIIRLQAFQAGEEFQVNTYVKRDQLNPAIAMDRRGNFVITWSSWEQDGSKYGIFAKIFKK